MTRQSGITREEFARRTTRPARTVVAAIAASGALVLAACGGDGDDGGDTGTSANGDGNGGNADITLNFAWWGDTSRADRYEQSIDLFEEANPGITVQTSFGSWPDYWSARNTEAAGGSLPDVMQMDIAYLTEYGRSGQIAPLEDYMGDQIDVSTLPESLLPSSQLDGTTYGIPTSTNTLATIINVDLLNDLGVDVPEEDLTWDQYYGFLTEIAAAGESSSPTVYGAVDHSRIFWLYQIWLGQQNLSMFTDDGQLGFTEEDLARWWEHPAQLREDGVLIPPERLAQFEGVDAIGEHEVGVEISWDNFLVRFSEGTGGDELTLLPPPADDLNQRGLFLKPSLLLSLSSTSEHPEEAAALIDFLVNDPDVAEIFGTSRGVPASSTALEAVEAEGLDAKILEYEESIEPYLTDSPPPPAPGFGAMEEAFVRIHEEVAYGSATPAEAAAQWFAEAESVMLG